MKWKSKKVLITGAGGFIGSHLAERLVQEGARVRTMVHYNALGRRGWLDTSDLVGEMEIFPGDIRDPESVREAMHDISVVFHLAALIAIPYSYKVPSSYVETNIMGTMNVLQAARQVEVEKVVHTSTSEVYGTARYIPIDEKHPLQGQSPYSASKIGADKMVEAFNLSFGLPTVTLRPFNTFGPRQSARAIVPTIITQCLKGEVVRLGHLNPTRDLNHVTNTVDSFLLAAGTDKAVGQTINSGFGQEISIGDLAKLIGRLMEREIKIISEKERERPPQSEVERLLADNTLAKNILGWEPQISLADGLKTTIGWIERNLDKYLVEGYVI